MSTLHKSAARGRNSTASSKKRSRDSVGDESGAVESEPVAKKRNKQRVLLLSSRGVTYRMRHLMNDLECLLPHIKKDSKLDSKNHLNLLPELADLHNCNNTLYFEARRHEDLYMWASKTPNGPSVKMHVQNVHTMDELKMTGNCLKGSRGIVSFDKTFDTEEHWRLLKEIFSQTFGVPAGARGSKPFVDHILTFSILDGKIWFRNYQLVEKAQGQPADSPAVSMVEIGPRFVMTPIRIFEGAFNGASVFANPEFVTPSAVRSAAKRALGEKYRERKAVEVDRSERREARRLDEDELGVTKVFS